MSEPNTPAAESKPTAASKAKAALIKNIIFAVFIILALIFCLMQFNKGQKIKELNRAVELLNEARGANPVDYTNVKLAEQVFEEFDEMDFDDEKALQLYITSKSLCYSTLADQPDLSAFESQQYYLKAFALDEANPDIPEALRMQFQGLTQEERTKRVQLKDAVQRTLDAGAQELRQMDAGVKATADEAKEAADEVADAVAEAAQEAGEAAKEAAEAVKEAAEKAAE